MGLSEPPTKLRDFFLNLTLFLVPSPPKSRNIKIPTLTETKKENQNGEATAPTGEFFRRRDEWRKHPSAHQQPRPCDAGLGIALVAFGSTSSRGRLQPHEPSDPVPTTEDRNPSLKQLNLRV
ncbi:uncharacterized protein LOC109823650 [Asparagus officinalis]|uniref:uncharacterized protein LOC109823650 n=1 Tax=Asparagus officinalis TaxID=4686 RepID=UPI00098E18A4|nr:uncharacterized protein LOC109823650 [Asparagus officinalis]